MAACGSSGSNSDAPAEANTSTDQTEFSINGGQSALSPGYEDNTVLKQLMSDAGISIEWNTMSDFLSEQVNIHIAGGELPDAFMGVGFSNYDLSNYGEDGTFIDLTPYLTEEYMPNLTKILEEHPEIKAAITMSDGKIYGLPSAELMGDYADDYVFLPVLTGPEGTSYAGNSNVTIRTGGATSSGNLSITSECESPANLLKFFDSWYNGETVMPLQYGPIDVFFTSQDENGVWNSITEDEAQAKYGKGAGELKSYYEVAGPKLILSNYYAENFKMEDRAIERLTDLYDYWMPQVKDTSVFPMDCVYTADELETIDEYKTDFQNIVAEQEGLWIKNGGPTDEEWEAYKTKLVETCGMDELLQAYQDAYDRYVEAQ